MYALPRVAVNISGVELARPDFARRIVATLERFFEDLDRDADKLTTEQARALYQRETERVKQFKQPGACLHCHASVIETYYEKGVEAGASPDDANILRKALLAEDAVARLAGAAALGRDHDDAVGGVGSVQGCG